jgi:uncharacterized protein YbjQ (UPF0145 family)
MGLDPRQEAGIPQEARKRLEQSQRGLFTSNLSVNEFLLVTDAGFEPVGLVIGSSIYQIGFQPPQSGATELTTLSQAMYSARDLAMTRMETEADQLGADGVIGVRLDIGRHDWGDNLLEFIAIGTAIRHGAGEVQRAPNGRPFTSVLSGQDFWTLLRAGHRPVSMVMGSCVYHVARRGAAARASESVEMTNITQAIYDARELAMGRMQDEAERCLATGIVGVQIEENNHNWGSDTVEFFAIGTAVIPAEGARGIQTPTPVISLDN